MPGPQCVRVVSGALGEVVEESALRQEVMQLIDTALLRLVASAEGIERKESHRTSWWEESIELHRVVEARDASDSQQRREAAGLKEREVRRRLTTTLHDVKGELATVGGEHWSVMEPGKPEPMEEGEAGLREVVVGDGPGPEVGPAEAAGDDCLASTYSRLT